MNTNRRLGRRGPLLTLLAGTGLAAVLLVASMVAASADNVRVAGGDEQPAGDATPSAPSAPSAAPSPEPSSPPPPATEPTEQPAVTYVGWADGGGASVAIIVTGDEATAYVCDGATTEAWLHGAAGGGYLRLAGDGGELIARYDRDWAVGQTTVAGRSWSFSLARVDPPEGLYRFADTIAGGAEVTGGWIVLPDGSQVGVLTVDGTPQPAPALDPATGAVRVGGAQVTAQRQG